MILKVVFVSTMIVLAVSVQAQNITTEGTTTNSSSTPSPSPEENEVPHLDDTPQTNPSFSFPGDRPPLEFQPNPPGLDPNFIYNKHIPVTFLDKIVRSINDKLTRFNQFLLLTKHPNFGGVQLLSPQYLWEKLHEKKPHYLTGPQGASVGLGYRPQVDYPFAYRNSRRIFDEQ